MKLTGVLVYLSVLSCQTLADENLPSVSVITGNIINVASKYAEAVSCGDQKIGPDDIAALVPWKTVSDYMGG